MYVSAADNDYVGVTGTFLGTPSQGVWSTARLDFSVPCGAFGGSIPGLVQQSAGTLDLYSTQIRASAFEGESVSVELRHRNHGQHTHHQQHGQRRELHHGGRRVHGDTDGLGRSNRGELRSHRGAHGRHADHHRGGLRGPAGLREPGLHLHGHERWSVDGQRGVRRRDELGHGLPQLFASNTLTVTNTSDFSDDLFLTKNWAGWSKLQVSNNSAAPDSGPELRLLGNQSARVFLERDGGAHQCELIMINDEALVQTKSLSTQLSLTTNQRNPGCLVIAGNTGNVVCNTSFTNLSDSRVKTEMAEADVAELQQLFDSVEAKQYKRPDMNEDLRLGFASDDFAGTKWKNLTGTARWSDGTEMVTLDYSHLTSVLWGVCKGFQARLDEVEAWQAQRGPKNK